MDTVQIEKKPKTVTKPSAYASIRIRKETRKALLQDMAKLNKKEFGKSIKIDRFIAKARTLMTQEHFRELQNESLSVMDRLKRDHQEYVQKNGAVSFEDYHEKRLNGKLQYSSEEPQPEPINS